MNNYYYLVSSLPMLFFHHGSAPISYSSFIEECRRLTDTKDFQQISVAVLNAGQFMTNTTDTLQKWQRIDFALRNELVRFRAKRMIMDPNLYLRHEYIDYTYWKLIEEAIDDFSPLRAEMHLMELQWKILDELQTGHHFDLEFLIIYSLKLQLLERKSSFNTEIGKKRLERVIFGDERE